MLKLDFDSQIFKVDPKNLFNPDTPIVFRCINILWLLSTSKNVYNSLKYIKHIASFS